MKTVLDTNIKETQIEQNDTLETLKRKIDQCHEAMTEMYDLMQLTKQKKR